MVSRKYLDYYKSKIITDEKGRVRQTYVYTGPRFSVEMKEEEKKGFKWKVFLLSLLFAVLYVAAAFIDCGMTRCFYTLLPYVGAFLPGAFLFAGIYQLFTLREPMTIGERDRSYLRLCRMSSTALCLLAVSAAGGGLYLILNRASLTGKDFLFWGITFAGAALLFLLRKISKKASLQLQNVSAKDI